MTSARIVTEAMRHGKQMLHKRKTSRNASVQKARPEGAGQDKINTSPDDEYGTPYVGLKNSERDKLNTLIRKTYKLALGLPPMTPTEELLSLGTQSPELSGHFSTYLYPVKKTLELPKLGVVLKKHVTELLKHDIVAARYVFAVAGFFGLMHLYVQRLNLSVAIVAMVRMTGDRNRTADTGCNFDDVGNASTRELHTQTGDFDWDEQTKSSVLSSFFYGYILLQFPGGRLADRYGGKHLMGSGVLVSSLLTLLTPAAARLHYTALMLVRFLMGVAGSCCFPAMQAMLAQWVPKAERTIISNIVFTGSFTGTVVAMTSTGVMSDSEVLGGWPSAFYLFGFTGCAWCLMWFLMIHNRPVEHPRISHGELMFITGGSVIMQGSAVFHLSQSRRPENMDVGRVSHCNWREQIMPIPWKAMLTSPAVWSLAATQWAHTYGSYTLMTELPNYLKNILGFGLTQNGILNGAPYLALSVLSLIIGWTSDVFRRRNVATVTTIRKICDSVSAFGPALCLIAVTMAPCERMLAVLWFWMAISLISFANSGFNCTHIDMAPAFAGTLFGITNCIGNTTGIIAPQVVGFLTETHNNVDSWKTVFYITAAVYTVGGLLFLLFGSAEPQEWAMDVPTTSVDLYREQQNRSLQCCNWSTLSAARSSPLAVMAYNSHSNQVSSSVKTSQ
ncbi:putative inorganic phosphate cotransporter [Dermacentor andersoni]|uniref:putative inorganic phosphate cotransporter n=1 Tax=Dermacentor andersoni TaxID=34620 RepID=UPI003B3B864B